MSLDVGFTPDPPVMVHRHVLKLFPESQAGRVHLHFLPDGYNAHKQGIAVVVEGDPQQEDETSYSRDLVRVSVYGPNHDQTRKMGRDIYTSLTQGVTGIGLGVSRARSTFFGSGPSYQPTGFVSTMSVSVGIAKFLATLT